MRAFTGLAALLLPVAAGAQISIDSHGVRSGGTRIDATGVHTGTTSVDATGVHGRRASGMTILTNNGNRSVDCGGRGLVVNGNRNRLTVANCSAVTVAGNGNVLNVAFGGTGRLSLLGNRNAVRWHAPRGAAISVSNVGNANGVTRAGG